MVVPGRTGGAVTGGATEAAGKVGVAGDGEGAGPGGPLQAQTENKRSPGRQCVIIREGCIIPSPCSCESCFLSQTSEAIFWGAAGS